MWGQIIDGVDLANEGGSILLYDWVAGEVDYGCNLMRVDPSGNILWEALPPTTGMQDCFTHMHWDGQTVTASTWSGYRSGIDTRNGNVTRAGVHEIGGSPQCVLWVHDLTLQVTHTTFDGTHPAPIGRDMRAWRLRRQVIETYASMS